jgi:hypothetical protein
MIARWMAQAAQQAELEQHGVRYAWVISHEYERDFKHEDWRRDSGRWKRLEGGTVSGPSTATEEEIKCARLHGTPMRMDYDGDGPALRGHLWTSDAENAWDSEAAFQPLEDYGEGGYGCTAICYRQNGEWVQL